jgi:hypothetical protein
MSLPDLQREAAALGHPERRKLMAFLVALNLRDDDGYRKEISSRLRDDQPGAWISLDEVEKRLGAADSSH